MYPDVATTRVFREIQNEVPQRLKPALIDSAQRGPKGPHYPSSVENSSAVCSAVSLNIFSLSMRRRGVRRNLLRGYEDGLDVHRNVTQLVERPLELGTQHSQGVEHLLGAGVISFC